MAVSRRAGRVAVKKARRQLYPSPPPPRPAPDRRRSEMHTQVMVLDCPAYTDRHGTTRCGLPATVENRYTISSTDGPQQSAKISCPRGHRFNGPIEALTRQVTDPQADSRRPVAGAVPRGP